MVMHFYICQHMKNKVFWVRMLTLLVGLELVVCSGGYGGKIKKWSLGGGGGKLLTVNGVGLGVAMGLWGGGDSGSLIKRKKEKEKETLSIKNLKIILPL